MTYTQYEALSKFAKALSEERNAVYNARGGEAAVHEISAKIGMDSEALLTFAYDVLAGMKRSIPVEPTEEMLDWLAPYIVQMLSIGIGFGRQANFGIGEATHQRDKSLDWPQQPGALPGNQLVSEREIAQIRALDDFDLVMLISEIHDHGWQVASHLLSQMAGRL